MSKYVRIQNDTAVEVFTPHNGFTIDDCFHPKVVALFSICEDDVTVGSTIDDKGVWTIAPVPEPVPAEVAAAAAIVYPELSPMEFYLAFQPMERIALKCSADPIVKEFWATYELSVQAGAKINMALKSTQEAINYLGTPVTATPPGPAVILPERIADILQGLAQ